MLIYGKALLAYSEEESPPIPQFYNHATDQFMKGNPFVPFNNPVDATLNYARVTTYDRSTMEQFKDVNNTIDRDRRIITCCFAYMFLYKAHQLDVSSTEILQYIKDIVRRVNTINQSKINSHKDMLLTARSIFQNFNSNKWIQECDNFLNSETKISTQKLQTIPTLPTQTTPFSQEQLRSMIDISQRTLETDPNDVSAWTTTALTMFVIAKFTPDLKTQIDNYKLSESFFKKALSLLMSSSNIDDSLDSTTKRTTRHEMINKAQTILSNLIVLDEEMKNLGIQRDPTDVTKFKEAYKLFDEENKRLVLEMEIRSKEGKKRIKYYSSDGKPIYE